jgi:hypothetical protein
MKNINRLTILWNRYWLEKDDVNKELLLSHIDKALNKVINKDFKFSNIECFVTDLMNTDILLINPEHDQTIIIESLTLLGYID